MSAQIYPTTTYSRMPLQQPAGPSSRRHPFTNAVNHPQYYYNQQATPPKQQEKPKQPASPPLPRQNSNTPPPSPPKVIRDSSGMLQFNRVGFLGEVRGFVFSLLQCSQAIQGGFARVYEVKDTRGARLACKVITKASLKTKKAKTKVSPSKPPTELVNNTVFVALCGNQDPPCS